MFQALATTRTGRSRLEHRYGGLDAEMAKCPCRHDSNRLEYRHEVQWREGTFMRLQKPQLH
ncbi:hypothetical protein SBF1_310023 [Candidatus Desulfosporosinus infrequens]|uniref:Uncharacterized protein n=1 Tax=Candidatus Desulfosporosinus infrequens TaxID=2043169 RepID=A0A2U3KY69_9FIRM|nr:hypothetical protein SBF1_310023 [Candidatus Desulfosporosinus infrequens]